MERSREEQEELHSEQTYNFRSSTKRKRLEHFANTTNIETYTWNRKCKVKSPISHMPTEVLQKIFTYIGFEELVGSPFLTRFSPIALSVRLVSRRFKVIINDKLTTTFKNLESKLENIRKSFCEILQQAQDDYEIQCLCKIVNVTEFLLMHHSIVKASLWRYLYNKHQPSNFCMYGGRLLDTYRRVIFQLTNTPEKLYTQLLSRDFAIPKDMALVASQSKHFTLHFDRVTEMPLNNSVFFSGSKLIDILDAATLARREVLQKSYNGTNVDVQLHYHFSHTWFVALDVALDKPKVWNEEQRLMYMRLRRIVLGHTEMHLEYEQYKREDMLRIDRVQRLKKPVNAVYTGYGEVGEKFFYYGVMNDGAYGVKFETQRRLFEIQEREAEREENNTRVENSPGTPFLGVDIYVDLKCPLALAPKKIIEWVEEAEEDKKDCLDSCRGKFKKIRGIFDMTVSFSCLSAQYPRLPTTHQVTLQGKR